MGLRNIKVGDNLARRTLYYNIPTGYAPAGDFPIVLGNQPMPWEYGGEYLSGLFIRNNAIYIGYPNEGGVGARSISGTGSTSLDNNMGRVTYINAEHEAYQYLQVDDEDEIYGYKDSGARQKALSEDNADGLRALISEMYSEIGDVNAVLATLTAPEEG